MTELRESHLSLPSVESCTVGGLNLIFLNGSELQIDDPENCKTVYHIKAVAANHLETFIPNITLLTRDTFTLIDDDVKIDSHTHHQLFVVAKEYDNIENENLITSPISRWKQVGYLHSIVGDLLGLKRLKEQLPEDINLHIDIIQPILNDLIILDREEEYEYITSLNVLHHMDPSFNHNLKDIDTYTPLMRCALRKDDKKSIDMAQWLVNERSVPIEEGNMFGWTPTILASKSGNLKLLKYLVELKAKLDRADHFYNTPLLTAVREGNVDVVALFIDPLQRREDGTSDDKLTPIPYFNIDARNRARSTSLMIAAKNGNERIIELLILGQADINVGNLGGWNALKLAAEHGHTQIAQALVLAKADVTDTKLSPPLHAACKHGDMELVTTLIEAKSSIHCRNDSGSTPVMLAVRGGHKHIVKYLVDHGADLSATNKLGWNTICYASDPQHEEMLEFLLQFETDINNHNGLSPLIIAVRCNLLSIVQKLLQHDADPNILHSSRNGQLLEWKSSIPCTPLMVAVKYGFIEIIESLLEKQADIHQTNSKGENSVLQLALSEGNEIVLTMIQEKLNSSVAEENMGLEVCPTNENEKK